LCGTYQQSRSALALWEPEPVTTGGHSVAPVAQPIAGTSAAQVIGLHVVGGLPQSTGWIAQSTSGVPHCPCSEKQVVPLGGGCGHASLSAGQRPNWSAGQSAVAC